MNMLSGTNDFFGLDIGTTGVRLVELSGSGPTKSLVRYAHVPIDAKVSQSNAKADQQRLAQVIADLMVQAKITTRNVAVGLPSSRVFTTVVEMEKLSPTELGKTIHLQADSLIPTPPASSTIYWALLGDAPADKTKSEVLLSSISNDFTEARLDMLESIGLNVIAFEPDNLALARSVMPLNATGMQLAVDIGAYTTDLVLCVNGTPRLARSISTGSDAIVRAAAQNLNVDDARAEQFVFKFGLAEDKLEGQVHKAVIGVVESLATEVEKSIKFATTRYADMKLERVYVTGAGATMPGFSEYLAQKAGVAVEIGDVWRNVSYPAGKQAELASIASNFAVAAGLAERTE